MLRSASGDTGHGRKQANCNWSWYLVPGPYLVKLFSVALGDRRASLLPDGKEVTQHAAHLALSDKTGLARGTAVRNSAQIGGSIQKVEPWPSVGSTQMRPPCVSRIAWRCEWAALVFCARGGIPQQRTCTPTHDCGVHRLCGTTSRYANRRRMAPSHIGGCARCTGRSFAREASLPFTNVRGNWGAGKQIRSRRSPHPHDLPMSLVEDARDGAIE
jgi:hypothetical protein